MAKINISLRIKPAHHNAIKQEIRKGKTLTSVFEEMLNEKFPSSEYFGT